MATAKEQTDKIVNYQGANNAYLNAIALAKELGVPELVDRIPYPMSTNVFNLTTPQEINQTKETSVKTNETGSKLSKLAKIAAIGGLIATTGGIGAAIPLGIELFNSLNKPQEVSPVETAQKIDPNFSFEVK